VGIVILPHSTVGWVGSIKKLILKIIPYQEIKKRRNEDRFIDNAGIRVFPPPTNNAKGKVYDSTF